MLAVHPCGARSTLAAAVPTRRLTQPGGAESITPPKPPNMPPGLKFSAIWMHVRPYAMTKALKDKQLDEHTAATSATHRWTSSSQVFRVMVEQRRRHRRRRWRRRYRRQRAAVRLHRVAGPLITQGSRGGASVENMEVAK